MIKHFCDDWIREWCQENGWTDLFMEHYEYWAFPPGGVMPLPIPKETLLQIKAKKGFSEQEKLWLTITIIASISAAILSYMLNSPMPLVFAFAFVAIIVANFDLE
jgi:hypothetical protein